MAKTITLNDGTDIHFFPDTDRYERLANAIQHFEAAEAQQGLAPVSTPVFTEMRLREGPNSELWNLWATLGEEHSDGRYVITIHPGLVDGKLVPGLRHLGSQNLQNNYRNSSWDIKPETFDQLRKGIVNGTQIHRVTLSDINQGRNIPLLGEACVVVRKYKFSNDAHNGMFDDAEAYADDPNVKARLLSRKRGLALFQGSQEAYGTSAFGNWHRLNSASRENPQGRSLFVGSDSSGLYGDYILDSYVGRFPGVAPEALRRFASGEAAAPRTAQLTGFSIDDAVSQFKAVLASTSPEEYVQGMPAYNNLLLDRVSAELKK